MEVNHGERKRESMIKKERQKEEERDTDKKINKDIKTEREKGDIARMCILYHN